MSLEIKNLKVKINDQFILNGVDLKIGPGEVHALMGPNGSGKSTLANVLMGNPVYEVVEGEILFEGLKLLEMDVHERALAGLFLAFQYPVEIPGVTLGKFLIRAKELQQNGQKLKLTQFVKEMKEKMQFLEMDESFINRYLNEGFSGGEKKRAEILQMLLLNPKLSILDETDSGLDIDALKIVSKGVNSLRSNRFSALIITHYQRILNLVQPDFVHILYKGKMIESGSSELVKKLESSGYDWIKEKYNDKELVG